ncbi:MAG: orotate phosphoribosyltransferase [Alphaproteobacteria bacterium]|nr:orotate phosphoribosyltransferase [Alphaproteobacteria bacterium]
MTPEEVLNEFEAAGALLKGHFILSSGLHSDTYLNKSIVATDAARTERLCRALAAKAREAVGAPDCVVAPAMGAIVYGYETSRHLNVPFYFVERVDGEFQLRRGFRLPTRARVLIVEDIVSTGLSARECVNCVTSLGAEVLAVACLIDRSNGAADVGAPLLPLAAIDVAAYAPDALPPHLLKTPAVKPGSRGVSQSA